MTRTVGLFGRQPAQRPVGLRMLGDYGEIPSAPAVFNHVRSFDSWQMYGNGPDPTLTVHGGQPVGDCGFAGAVHLEMATAAETSDAITWPDSDEVVSAYLNYNDGVDKGVALANLLAFWRSNGLWGRKISAYAPINVHNKNELWAACNAFGALYIGIAVPAVAQEQFAQGRPWSLTHTQADYQIVGGHCVVITSKTLAGGTVVTWGQEQPFTNAWLSTYLEEAWVMVTPEQIEANGNGYGLDMVQLQADLDRVG
jgi:hypothetical protein